MTVFIFTNILTLFFTSCVQGLGVKNFISIQLMNGSYYEKVLINFYEVPNVEELFKIDDSNVKKLKIENTGIDKLEEKIFKNLRNLKSLEITYNSRLRKIHKNVFSSNTELTYLNLGDNNIDYIEPRSFDELFQRQNVLGKLDLRYNRIHFVPAFYRQMKGLTTLILDGNPLEEISKETFSNLTHLEILSMKETEITTLHAETFQANKFLHTLDLRKNLQLTRVHRNSFIGASTLRKLFFSDTGVTHLPFKGLDNLRFLEIKNTHNLWDIPNGLIGIPTLQTVFVSSQQRFLCCAFEMKRAKIGLYISKEHLDTSSQENLCTTPSAEKLIFNTITSQPSTTTDFFAAGFIGKKKRKRRSNGFEGFLPPTKNPNSSETMTTLPPKRNTFFPGGGGGFIDNIVTHSEGTIICNPNSTGKIHYNDLKPVVCLPEPDELRPCDDIMGNLFLTILSWFVSIVALLGNSIVFCVLILSRRSNTVTKFLLLNLSFADLVLALYLFILVSASAHTHGEYYNYVRQWQYGGGCSLSGFLAVFASQLSMLVLVVITIERYFAIVYAMHFHRRVTMNYARAAMITCWVISFIMAILPVAGVNSYNEVAICLPFKTESKSDMAYIGILLVMNIFFFLFVLGSYVRMYCIVKSPHLDCRMQRNDSEVAKRMALLVFTDFFCWAPIAFVGLVSAFGHSDLLDIDVKKSKYLLVIFYPINSLCNPFLYAVSTNSFKRDFFDLLLRCGLFQDRIAKINEGMYTNSMSNNKFTRKSSDVTTYSTQLSRTYSSMKKKKPSKKHSLMSQLILRKSFPSPSQSELSNGRLTDSKNNSPNLLYKKDASPQLSPLSPILSDDAQVKIPLVVKSDDESVKKESCKRQDTEIVELDDNGFELTAIESTETTPQNNNKVFSFNKEKSKELDKTRKLGINGTTNIDPSGVVENSKNEKTRGFSSYDLSQDAFQNSKETTVL